MLYESIDLASLPILCSSRTMQPLALCLVEVTTYYYIFLENIYIPPFQENKAAPMWLIKLKKEIKSQIKPYAYKRTQNVGEPYPPPQTAKKCKQLW